LSVDPLTSSYPFLTPYNFAMNGPITTIDPDGRAPEWVPDKYGNLLKEEGDDVNSLYSYFEGTKSMAETQEIYDQSYDNGWGEIYVNLNNPVTKTIKEHEAQYSFFWPAQDPVVVPGTMFGYDDWKKLEGFDYNCGGAASSWACGGTPNPKPTDYYFSANHTSATHSPNHVGKDLNMINFDGGAGVSTTQMETNLRNYYTEVSGDDAKPLITIVRVQNFNSSNEYDIHYGIYYGRDNSGNMYIASKPGFQNEPRVDQLKEFSTTWIPSLNTRYQVTGFFNLNE